MDQLFVFQGEAVLIGQGELPDNIELISQGTVPGVGQWIEVSAQTELPGWEPVPRRLLWNRAGPEAFATANRLYAQMDWSKNSIHCGRCGTATRLSDDGAMVCERCGHRSYPIISPAIIVAVEREGTILLAHNAAWPSGRYSILAGFVELGESLEDAVHREVREETGIEISDLRYFGSQSWPFPRSLMVGFHARWLSGEITADGLEITHASWFAPEELPQIPQSPSISRQLIDDFTDRCQRSREP